MWTDRKGYITPILWLTLWVSAASAQQVVDEIVVVVNDDIILKSDLERRKELVSIAANQELQGPELENTLASIDTNLVRDLIDETLLLQRAEESGFDASIFVLQQMERLRVENDIGTLEELYAAIEAQGDSVSEFEETMANQYLTSQVLQQDVDFRISVTTEELRERYESNPDAYNRPEGVAIQEIVLGTEGQDVEEVRVRIEELLARARDGENFQELAFEESESTTANAGGDVGFIARGDLREEYESVAYELGRNQISDVIELKEPPNEAPIALAIIKLVQRHQGGLLPFELARNEVAFEIENERIPEARRDYLEQLRRESYIEIQEGYVDSGAPEEPADEEAP